MGILRYFSVEKVRNNISVGICTPHTNRAVAYLFASSAPYVLSVSYSVSTYSTTRFPFSFWCKRQNLNKVRGLEPREQAT